MWLRWVGVHDGGRTLKVSLRLDSVRLGSVRVLYLGAAASMAQTSFKLSARLPPKRLLPFLASLLQSCFEQCAHVSAQTLLLKLR